MNIGNFDKVTKSIRIGIIVLGLLFPATTFAQGLLKRDTLVHRRSVTEFAGRVRLSVSNTLAIPADYHTQCFGFFCKQELKMQKAHIPVTFRLGNMEYVNWMEGKNTH